MADPNPTLKLDASPAAVIRAAAMLRMGGLVAMPTETVYGLAANAFNAAAVERIFAAKGRPHWDPLIVHVADLPMLLRVVQNDLNSRVQGLIKEFWPGPLTLLLQRTPGLPQAVTAGRELVGVRMPAHPVALAIIAAAGCPLAAPSANRFGHVSPTTAAHVLDDLDGRIDAVVDAGPCSIGVESTVAAVLSDRVVVYRAGGIPVLELERTAGLPVQMYVPPVVNKTEPASLPSPGVSIRHYATRATLLLVSSQAELQRLLHNPEYREAAVLLPLDWPRPLHAGPIATWANFADAPALAAELYRCLRALDEPGPRHIVVPMPNREDGMFAALRDRLLKAARPPA